MIRGERLIECGYSWFSSKFILVMRVIPRSCIERSIKLPIRFEHNIKTKNTPTIFGNPCRHKVLRSYVKRATAQIFY